MNRLTVNLAENSYDIIIGSSLLSSLGEYLSSVISTSKVAIVTNPEINALYGETTRLSLSKASIENYTIVIPAGEEHKNLETISSIYDALIDAALDRKSAIIALGGGVVGDMAGFAAATYLRGIPFIQIPTSLLAQVDSSVGGKTGVDHKKGKNLIGAFYQPKLVLIDIDTLKTLPVREFRAGMAEVIKYGAIIDEQFFSYLELNIDKILAMQEEELTAAIFRCCELKAQVVELDEKESGLRAVLNYGHTLGHAFETAASYNSIVHGEGVAIGMSLSAKISQKLGYASENDAERIDALLNRAALDTKPLDITSEKLIAALVNDKKSRSGKINFVANRGIGDYTIVEVSPKELLNLAGLEG